MARCVRRARPPAAQHHRLRHHRRPRPAANKLTATADVTFTALEDLTSATFELNNGLNITSLTTTPVPSSTPSASPPTPPSTSRFPRPVQGLVQHLSLCLLRHAHRFGHQPRRRHQARRGRRPHQHAPLLRPLVPALHPRPLHRPLHAEMHITVPAGYTVVGSGAATKKATSAGGTEFSFVWSKPGFPGTIVAGSSCPRSQPQASPTSTFTSPKNASRRRRVCRPRRPRVRIPHQHLRPARVRPHQHRRACRKTPSIRPGPRRWWRCPATASSTHRRLAPPARQHARPPVVGFRGLPATLNDAWITNGMSRYGELMYLETPPEKTPSKPPSAMSPPVPWLTTPNPSAPRPDRSLLYPIPVHDPRKGRDGLPHAPLGAGRRRLPAVSPRHARAIHRPRHSHRRRPEVAEAQSAGQAHLDLTAFFAQWIDGTGAPAFVDKYSVYRLAATRASAPSAPSAKTSTSSACRSS